MFCSVEKAAVQTKALLPYCSANKKLVVLIGLSFTTRNSGTLYVILLIILINSDHFLFPCFFFMFSQSYLGGGGGGGGGAI